MRQGGASRSMVAITRRPACAAHDGEHRGRKQCDPHQAVIAKGVLAACALTASFFAGAAATPVMTPPPVADAQLAEVLVVGKQPGPGLWRISKGDHDLWIFATLAPLPKQMIWDTADIEKHVGQSQAVLAPPRIDPLAGLAGEVPRQLE
jgi:hypothetical protein